MVLVKHVTNGMACFSYVDETVYRCHLHCTVKYRCPFHCTVNSLSTPWVTHMYICFSLTSLIVIDKTVHIPGVGDLYHWSNHQYIHGHLESWFS